ncbi:MAG: PolC-type DNA polymerase III [Erysipelotrichaceae bacterium]|nr:PolC-type DNA polymerase III [Erysipelotrichaceae bacterium]
MIDYLELLSRINASDKLKAAFRNAVFCRPQVHRKSGKVEMLIKNADFAPSEQIDELKKKLTSTLGRETCLIFEVANPEISYNQLQDYLLYYNKIHDSDINDVPVIKPDVIYINVDQNQAEKLIPFLKSLGVKQEIVPGRPQESAIKEVVIETGTKRANFEDFRRSKFSKEDDYQFMPMNRLMASDRKVKCVGKIFHTEKASKRSKNNRRFTIETVIVTDFTDAVTFKRFDSDLKIPELSLTLYEGQTVEIFGIIAYDSFDNNNVFKLHCIRELDDDPFTVKDNYPDKKHIDLHVHTNRSEMDGNSPTESLIKRAFDMGQKAIAITDTSVVQAFPLAQTAHFGLDKKHPGNDFKVIYGMDVKVADSSLRIVYNPTDQKVKGSEYAVIDFETTGLSTRFDHIIEFGGVVVKNNSVTEIRKQLFVKPPVDLPPFIEKKTNITNQMLANARPIEEAIDEILEFLGDRIIVAHNADFDFNFLNDTLIRLGRKPLTNVCLDTLNLARMVVQDRKYYRLGVIANYYGVEYDENTAHRGDYDAEVLANVLVRMLPDIENYDTVTFRQLQDNQPDDIYKKARTYNCTLLARNMDGIRKLYEIVTLSHTKYLTYFAKKNAKKIDTEVQAEPRIIKEEIEKRRSDLIVGSSNQFSELFEMAMNRSLTDMKQCMKFYDYIEINPVDNYRNLMEEGTAVDRQRIIDVLNDMISAADELGKPIIASNDVYYANPYEKAAHEIFINASRIGGGHHPLWSPDQKKRQAFKCAEHHLMSTEQLLKAFSFTDRAKEFVIDNPNMIADKIEKLYPIHTKLAVPDIPGAEENLKSIVYKNAYERYGDPLPEIVASRLEKELGKIIEYGNTVQYYIAHLLVRKSNEDGYPVGSRGSVGSSFVATMADITEVNPLVPHYLCPNCHHSEFFENNEYANGFDLPEKNCPVCGSSMIRDGHNIPFETFLGFEGDKVPDIDLNFSEDYQSKAQKMVSDVFGEEYSFRAGTISGVKTKIAYGYIKAYCEDMNIPMFSNSFTNVLTIMCEDVKRTSGQHPGGIVVIPKNTEIHDFTPLQYPANNPFSEWQTTHFAFKDLHDSILKLDILGHVDPKAIRELSIISGIRYQDVPFNDPAALSLFSSTEAMNIIDYSDYHEVTGAAGLPEFGTHNNRRILAKTRPTTFNELVNFEGLTHGTDVWANNAEMLVDQGIATINEVISCRDDIMTYLISKGVEKKASFDIMERVRKGKGLLPDQIDIMNKNDVPQWYIDSCQLIKYMFPKAHAVAYAMNAVRVAWYKVHQPLAYYAVFFSIRCPVYEIETMMEGQEAIIERLRDIQKRIESHQKISTKEEALEPVLEIALEMYLRGYHFSLMSLKKSAAKMFLPDPDDPTGIMPSFSCIDGMGDVVANRIVEEREGMPFISREDFGKRTGVNTNQLATMERLGVLRDLPAENQLSLF